MAQEDAIREERIIKKTAIKTTYEFEDSEKGIKILSKEVFHNTDKEIHYPWNFDGSPKYKNIKQFIYEGFDGKLPVGVYKVATFGYGFSNKLQPLGDYLGEVLKIETVKITKTGTARLSKTAKEVVITEKDLRKWFDVFQVKLDQQKQERAILAQQQLKLIYESEIDEVELLYVKNSIAGVISTWGNSLDEFSEKDKNAIKEMFDRLSLTDDFFTPQTLLDTKSKIDKKYIDDVIDEFKVLMRITTDSDATEKKWQEFLGTHSWIFSYIFSFPIILFENEAYVGGKNVSNTNGKVTDFLIKNNLTNNVAFLEIKTHKSELVKKGKAYRGNDVYAMSSDLSGAISQVLNQRDNFQKHYANLKVDSSEDFETFNSKCVVLMGQIKSLESKQLRPFELIRSNSKDVEIVTFDELQNRVENIQKLIEGKYKQVPKKRKAKKVAQ
ncbi:protein of unknown function [Chitinophaga rupis]|uniref:Shedu protein SduA C-terminal domain-containing protein n=1 Tax=Chitinophaga rupis TaxID=573321 RepID=A0A1H7VZK3_9BACT|nr:Shedu immune nuclease family protein [Chitinophaga rupis]SEM14228.1 protein of unknown function [Chitinophaga rupis]